MMDDGAGKIFRRLIILKNQNASRAITLSTLVSIACLGASVSQAPNAGAANAGKTQAQVEKDKDKEKDKSSDKDKAPEKDKSAAEKSKSGEKTAAAKPEPVIPDVQSVTTDQLVDKPHEYLNKNIRFTALFASFSNLALDYKPALRAAKNNVSFLVYRANSKIPYSEIKLAMPMPKETDPENHLLLSLKDGDELEVTGKVFATALDEPWVDVLRLKRLHAVAEDKKTTASEVKEKDKAAGEPVTTEKGGVPKDLKKPDVPADPEIDKTKPKDGGKK
jgi:hypothetical protein